MVPLTQCGQLCRAALLCSLAPMMSIWFRTNTNAQQLAIYKRQCGMCPILEWLKAYSIWMMIGRSVCFSYLFIFFLQFCWILWVFYTRRHGKVHLECKSPVKKNALSLCCSCCQFGMQIGNTLGFYCNFSWTLSRFEISENSSMDEEADLVHHTLGHWLNG